MNKIALLLSLYLLASNVNAQVVEVKNNTLTPARKNQMVQIMAGALKNQKMPSIVAAATLGDKVIWVQSLGYADLEKKITVKPNFHMFRWASVTKVATDIMVQAMDEKGVLDLDKPISNYYATPSKPFYIRRCFTEANHLKYFQCRGIHGSAPVINMKNFCFDPSTLDEFKNNKGNLVWVSDKKLDRGQVVFKTKKKKDLCRIDYKIDNKVLESNIEQITLRTLLNHRSGIQHYEHLGRDARPPLKSRRNKMAIKKRKANKISQMAWAIPYFFPRQPLVARPGKMKLYSSFGHNLAGVILEKQTGMLYENLMELYGAKMGAKSIQADYLGIASQRGYSRTFVYKRASNKWIKNNYTEDNSYKIAGGGMMSTITDLARFCVGISNDGYFLNKGISSYSHDGAHPDQSQSKLNLKTNADGKKQCLVLMTNTEHDKVDLEALRISLDKKLKDYGIWKN